MQSFYEKFLYKISKFSYTILNVFMKIIQFFTRNCVHSLVFIVLTQSSREKKVFIQMFIGKRFFIKATVSSEQSFHSKLSFKQCFRKSKIFIQSVRTFHTKFSKFSGDNCEVFVRRCHRNKCFIKREFTKTKFLHDNVIFNTLSFSRKK